MTANRFAAALLCFAPASPTTTYAGLVTWELEGQVAEVVGSWISFDTGPRVDEMLRQLEAVGIDEGVMWRARMTFDAEAPAVPTDYGVSEFEDAETRIEFFAGNYSAATPVGAAGTAWAGTESALPCCRSLLTFSAQMAADSSSLPADSAHLQFRSEDPNLALPSSLPSEPPDPSDFSYPGGVFNPYNPSARWAVLSIGGRGFVPDGDLSNPSIVEQQFWINGHITTITRVPEPAAVALTLVAAAAIAIRPRSRALP